MFSHERKYITVVFSDLSGYTTLSERYDPELVRDILSEIYKMFSKTISKYDGFIEKYIGDAVMAIFGVPKSREDDAIRAVYASIEIHSLIKKVNEKYKEKLIKPLFLHTGINTGLAITGEIDFKRGTHGVSGDTVNISARLSSIAKADQILIGPSTYRRVKKNFIIESLGRQKIKGKKEKVNVYRLIEAYASEKTILKNKKYNLNSKVFGRDSQIAYFLNCISELDSAKGRIICIRGEAGIGKSRLIAEIRNRLNENDQIWLEGRCLNYSQGTSLFPFNIILKEFANISEEDNKKKAWKKLRNSLSNSTSIKMEKAIPFIAYLLSIPVLDEYKSKIENLDGEAIKRQIFMLLKSFFYELSKKSKIILIFEDIQWIDETSIELINHLIPGVKERKILFCFVYRPMMQEYIKSFIDKIEQTYKNFFALIELSAMDYNNSKKLAKNLLDNKDIPPNIIHFIAKRSGGNPFYIEELINSMIQLNFIVLDEIEGKYNVVYNLEKVSVPDSLRGVISARIDMLSEDLKDILKLASVIGMVFFYRVIEEILKPDNNLRLKLNSLQSQNLIQIKKLLPDIEYIFKHALTQEISYESILIKQRRKLHQIVADSIETLFDDRKDDFLSMLAYHYTYAENWEKAQHYLFKAGDKAGDIAADSESLNHYKKAIIAYEKVFGDKWDSFQRSILERKIGQALFRKGHHQQSIEYFLRALDLIGESTPEKKWFIRLSMLKHILIQIKHRIYFCIIGGYSKENKRLKEILLIYEMMGWIDFFMNRERLLLHSLKGLNLSEKFNNQSGISRAAMSLGIFFDMIGFFKIAKSYHRRSLQSSNATLSLIDLGHSYLGMAFHEDFKGRWKEAISYYRKSAEHFFGAGDMRKWGDPIIMIIFLLTYKGYFRSVKNLSKKIAKIGQNTGDQQLLGWGMQGQGLGYFFTKKYDIAEIYLRESVDLLEMASDYYASGIAKKDLGLTYLKQRKFNQAINILDIADKQFTNHHLNGHLASFIKNAIAESYLYLAENESNKDKKRLILKKCKKFCKAAVKESGNYCWAIPQAYRLNGSYKWIIGDFKNAKIWWNKSINKSNNLGATFQIQITNEEKAKRTIKNNSKLKGQ